MAAWRRLRPEWMWTPGTRSNTSSTTRHGERFTGPNARPTATAATTAPAPASTHRARRRPAVSGAGASDTVRSAHRDGGRRLHHGLEVVHDARPPTGCDVVV